MSDLIDFVLDAHGGTTRWERATRLSATMRVYGDFWAFKGQPDLLSIESVEADIHQQRIRMTPFGNGHSFELDSASDQVKELRGVTESLLREHKGGIVERQFAQKRLADSVADIYAQIAVLSRVTQIFENQGVEPSGQERYIAETFCTRAAGRVSARLKQISENDDERMSAIAKLAYKRGSYGYALFED